MKKRYTAEQIIGLLRQAEVELAQGRSVGEICRGLGVETSKYPPLGGLRAGSLPQVVTRRCGQG